MTRAGGTSLRSKQSGDGAEGGELVIEIAARCQSQGKVKIIFAEFSAVSLYQIIRRFIFGDISLNLLV